MGGSLALGALSKERKGRWHPGCGTKTPVGRLNDHLSAELNDQRLGRSSGQDSKGIQKRTVRRTKIWYQHASDPGREKLANRYRVRGRRPKEGGGSLPWRPGTNPIFSCHATPHGKEREGAQIGTLTGNTSCTTGGPFPVLEKKKGSWESTRENPGS